MKLAVLGSGSTGNGYVLFNEHEAIVLEAGMPIRDCLGAVGYNSAIIKGCLITHEHGDHARFADDYMRYFQCYCSQGTADSMKISTGFKPNIMCALETYKFGGFSVRPIEAEHDAAEPFAFIIEHEEIGRMLFATDTYFIRYTIPGMTNMVIECNYSMPILNENVASGCISEELKNRTLHSHMSLENLKELIRANDMTSVSQIILIHMSARNSDCEAFVREIEAMTGKCTFAAKKGHTFEISKTPF